MVYARRYNRPGNRTGYVRAVGAAAAGGAAYAAKKLAYQAGKHAVYKGVSAVKARYYKKRTPYIKQKTSLKKQVKEIRRQVNADTGTLIYRYAQLGSGGTSVNSSGVAVADEVTISKLETVLAQLRFYNPSVPGTLTQADGSSGTYQRDYLFNKITCKVLFRNNYQIPCHLRVFIVVPKEDTSISAVTAFTSGCADVGGISTTALNVYLTDSQQFNDLWKIVSSKKFTLNPGREAVVTHSIKPFQYDPSFADSHNLTYQTRYRNFQVIYRLEGVLSHDSAASEYGISQARIDIRSDITYEVKYSAGADIKFIYLNNDADTPTNGFVSSNMPVSDNQAYSVA